jgi:hypothetical protein
VQGGLLLLELLHVVEPGVEFLLEGSGLGRTWCMWERLLAERGAVRLQQAYISEELLEGVDEFTLELGLLGCVLCHVGRSQRFGLSVVRLTPEEDGSKAPREVLEALLERLCAGLQGSHSGEAVAYGERVGDRRGGHEVDVLSIVRHITGGDNGLRMRYNGG